MPDMSNTPVDAQNLSFLEQISQPYVWKLLSFSFGALLALIAWLVTATFLNVQGLNVEVATIKIEISAIKENQSEMKSDIKNLGGKMDTLIEMLILNGFIQNRPVQEEKSDE